MLPSEFQRRCSGAEFAQLIGFYRARAKRKVIAEAQAAAENPKGRGSRR